MQLFQLFIKAFNKEYFVIHNIHSPESIKVDYTKNIGGDKVESYQDIKNDLYKPVKKSQTDKVVPISKFQDFYDELLNYRNSKASSANNR